MHPGTGCPARISFSQGKLLPMILHRLHPEPSLHPNSKEQPQSPFRGFPLQVSLLSLLMDRATFCSCLCVLQWLKMGPLTRVDKAHNTPRRSKRKQCENLKGQLCKPCHGLTAPCKHYGQAVRCLSPGCAFLSDEVQAGAVIQGLISILHPYPISIWLRSDLIV